MNKHKAVALTPLRTRETSKMDSNFSVIRKGKEKVKANKKLVNDLYYFKKITLVIVAFQAHCHTKQCTPQPS